MSSGELERVVQLLEQVAVYESTSDVGSTQVREVLRREALSSIMAIAEQQLQKIQTFRQPTPLKQVEKRSSAKRTRA
jgi:stalled ribosome rescue protein Dom34